MKWLTTTAVLLFVSAYASAKPIPPQAIPTPFQGDWINIAATAKRAQVCQEIRDSSYFDVSQYYLLSFNPNSVEHRVSEVYLEDVKLKFATKDARHLQGSADQTYQEAGADKDFPSKRGLKFDWHLQSDGSLRAPHLKIKTFYPCPTAPDQG